MSVCGFAALIRLICAPTLISLTAKCSRATSFSPLFTGSAMTLSKFSSKSCPLASVELMIATRVHFWLRKYVAIPAAIASLPTPALTINEPGAGWTPGEKHDTIGPDAISGASALHSAVNVGPNVAATCWLISWFNNCTAVAGVEVVSCSETCTILPRIPPCALTSPAISCTDCSACFPMKAAGPVTERTVGSSTVSSAAVAGPMPAATNAASSAIPMNRRR
jgi:hypothetical protein